MTTSRTEGKSMNTNRDGGDHPRYTNGRRPMTTPEAATFAEQLATAINQATDIEAHHDGNGSIVAHIWSDDEEGGVVTYTPTVAVTS